MSKLCAKDKRTFQGGFMILILNIIFFNIVGSQSRKISWLFLLAEKCAIFSHADWIPGYQLPELRPYEDILFLKQKIKNRIYYDFKWLYKLFDFWHNNGNFRRV